MKTLVIYFSKTGTTRAVADMVAERLGADHYEIKEAVPYTAADLNWNIPTSRANQEQADENSRPAYAGNLPDLTAYDQVIIGHPTWWGRPPRIIQTVLADLDLTSKQVATFATSGGSTYSQAQEVMNRILDHPMRGAILSNQRDVNAWISNHHLAE